MQRPCRSCSRNFLFTFLESVTGIRNTRLLHTRWFHYARSMSSALSSDPSISNSTVYDEIPMGKDDFATRLLDKASVAQDGGASVVAISNRKSGNIKSWEEQRQHLFRNTKLEQSADVRDAGHHKNMQASTTPNYASHSTSKVSGMESEKINIARGTKKPHQFLERRGLARDVKISKRYLVHGSAPQANKTTTSSATPLVPPRKKDRWRNRVSSSAPAESETRSIHSSGTSSKDYKSKVGREDARSKGGLSENQRSELSKARSTMTVKNTAINSLTDAEIDAEIPAWKIHKRALKAKLGDQAWNPLKRLSPDAREGVRQLHREDPVLWSTPNLANHFQLSPDAIRRILKSKWTPTDEEREEQQQRWIRRGETIWDRYVEIGYKAPRKWRGLNPMSPPKSSTAAAKAEFKPEEWSQDQDQDLKDESDTGLGLGLENRIR